MPGDRDGGVPKMVEAEWVVTTPEIKKMQDARNARFAEYTPPWMEETTRINSITPRITRQFDLQPILTPALLDKVRANPQSINVKLTVIFKDDQFTVQAEPEVWR